DSDVRRKRHRHSVLHGAFDEISVLPDITKGLVKTDERLEDFPAYEQIAERDVMRRSDGAGAGSALVRRDAAANPRRRQQQIRNSLSVGSIGGPQIRAPPHAPNFQARPSRPQPPRPP